MQSKQVLVWELLSCLVLATSLDTFAWNMKSSFYRQILKRSEKCFELSGEKNSSALQKVFSVARYRFIVVNASCKLIQYTVGAYTVFFSFLRLTEETWIHFETFLHFHRVNASFIFANKMLYTVNFYCLTYICTIHVLFITANTAQLQLYDCCWY